MFDLEKAIKKWRNSLKTNEALEDGAKEELECHLRDKIEHLIDQGNPEEKAFEEALAKLGTSQVLGTEYYRETTRRLSGRPVLSLQNLRPLILRWNRRYGLCLPMKMLTTCLSSTSKSTFLKTGSFLWTTPSFKFFEFPSSGEIPKQP